MDIRDEQLRERYAVLSTDELARIRSANDLTDQARPILDAELESRGSDTNPPLLSEEGEKYRSVGSIFQRAFIPHHIWFGLLVFGFVVLFANDRGAEAAHLTNNLILLLINPVMWILVFLIGLKVRRAYILFPLLFLAGILVLAGDLYFDVESTILGDIAWVITMGLMINIYKYR